MNSTVTFREFEERDIDFVQRCKNDEKLNSMIVNQSKQFTREDAEKWVHGCMGEHDSFKFWAICTNDEEQRIVGWTSLSQIDSVNKSVCLHGTVIGDADYRDGMVMFEAQLFCLDYIFNKRGFNRAYGSCFSDHPISPYILSAIGFVHEGTRREYSYREGQYHDLNEYGMLKREYDAFVANGDFEQRKLVKKFLKFRKQK